MGDPMEAVAVNPVLLCKLVGKRVGSGDAGHRVMKRRVEDRNHGDLRAEDRPGSVYAIE